MNPMRFLHAMGIFAFCIFSFGCDEVPSEFPEVLAANLPEIAVNNCTTADNCIAIVSHYAGNQPYVLSAIENHKAYAKKHGYDYVFRSGVISGGEYKDPSASTPLYRDGLYWQKITAVEDLLKQDKYAAVLWLDADALFANMEITIEHIMEISANKSFIIASDDISLIHDQINAGVFIVKNNVYGKNAMKAITRLFPYYKELRTPEQQAIQDLMYGYVFFNSEDFATFTPISERDYESSRIVNWAYRTPQRRLNAFYREPMFDSSKWHSGDYIVHFAGSGNKNTEIPAFLQCMANNNIAPKDCE